MIPNPPPTSWLEIDLSAVAHNTRVIAQAAGVPLMAVIKSDGYGHGAVPVAETFLKSGGLWLGVVRVEEALVLRRAGIQAPILLVGSLIPEQLDAAIAAQVTMAVGSLELLQAAQQRAAALQTPALVHLKVDTGMGRLGTFPQEAGDFAAQAQASPWVRLDGVFSHLASAGDDPVLTGLQISRFEAAVAAVRAAGANPAWIHLSNSAAIALVPEARFNLVRAGGILYGITQELPAPWIPSLRPSMTWKARLLSVKTMPAGWAVSYGARYLCSEGERIGVLPVGHGDGYRRSEDNQVLVGGQRARVVGLNCMDLSMVSLPAPAAAGDEVVLLGRQGSQQITVEELRNRWRSSYSGVCLIHPRIPRVYFPAGD